MSEDGVSKAPEASEAASPDASELEAIGSQMAYDSFVVAAKALDLQTLEECRTDIPLVYSIVNRGVESVVGSAVVVVNKLPNVNIEQLSTLPRLVQGLAFAAVQVNRELKAAPFATLFDRAQYLRRKMGSAADALVYAGLVPAADVEAVRVHSRIDVVEECLALAAVFQKHEARATGSSPVTKMDLQETEQVAKRLRALLDRPTEENEVGSMPALMRALEMRDRFWTLLNQRYDVLWRCGAWLYGRAVDERVPPLPHWNVPGRRAVMLAEREYGRTAAEPRALARAPQGAPVRMTPPTMVPARDTSRHLSELERKTRFLIRFGVFDPPRR
jgi:hypothetical protein